MQVREDFITNSSTTSFTIIGGYISSSDMSKEVLEKFEECGSDMYDFLHDSTIEFPEGKTSKSVCIEHYRHPDYYGSDEPYYVGVNIDSVPEDYTIKEAKKVVSSKLSEIFGTNINAGLCTDGWYDG
jgi:hypothetical protein